MKPIRNSAKAVIIHQSKVLLTKNRDDEGDFYIFPGGGQERGEPLSAAVVRECIEETGLEVIVHDLIYVREYIGKNHEFAEWDADVHQVEFYFECRLKAFQEELGNGANPDATQVGVEWIDLASLDEIRVYPNALAKLLKAGKADVTYLGDVN
ncbi:NUDIX domain-containing protein [Paenibacillus tarimensis]